MNDPIVFAPETHPEIAEWLGPWGYRFLNDREYGWDLWSCQKLEEYRGKYVAFYDKQIIDADADGFALEERVHERLGVHPSTIYTMFVR